MALRFSMLRGGTTLGLSDLASSSFHGLIAPFKPRPIFCNNIPQRFNTQIVRAASSSSKSKQSYRCTECGETTLQWSGQCKSCKQWSTLEKITIAPTSSTGGGGGGGARAAARFSAEKALSGSFDDDGPPPSFARAGVRRTSWVQDIESPQRLSDVSQRSFRQRWRLRLPGESGEELCRVLGGGVVPGSLILVGGEPGVGKSTLLLQVADMLTHVDSTPGTSPSSLTNDTQENSNDNFASILNNEEEEKETDPADAPDRSNPRQRPVLYVSGEESAEQIGSRAERMGIGSNPEIYLFSATRLELIFEAILRLRPRAIIIDSIQTVYLDDLPSSAGSVVQVRECASALLQVAKREGIPVFLVGHVTKSGDIAGPRVLEHIVDVVVYMEGGRQQAMRLVRCTKNRYGATDEVGVFGMEDAGLRAVLNPSAFFLSSRDTISTVSSAVTVVMEGTRPLLMEVQALCSPVPPNSTSPPLRAPTGVKKDRLWLILAVLGKHTKIRPYSIDVHINVTGGLMVNEPAADLAIATAIASSYYEKPIAKDTAFVAEVGLGGELRPVLQLEKRITEALKLGFHRVVIPHGSDVKKKSSSSRLANATLIECRNVSEAFDAGLVGGGGGGNNNNNNSMRKGGSKQSTARRDGDDDFEEY